MQSSWTQILFSITSLPMWPLLQETWTKAYRREVRLVQESQLSVQSTELPVMMWTSSEWARPQHKVGKASSRAAGEMSRGRWQNWGVDASWMTTPVKGRFHWINRVLGYRPPLTCKSQEWCPPPSTSNLWKGERRFYLIQLAGWTNKIWTVKGWPFIEGRQNWHKCSGTHQESMRDIEYYGHCRFIWPSYWKKFWILEQCKEF